MQHFGLLHDADDNSSTYHHPLPNNHSMPDNYPLHNNHWCPHNHSLHLCLLRLPKSQRREAEGRHFGMQ